MTYQISHESLSRFGSLEFLARQVVEGFITGLHKSPFHGFSVEFSEHRLYNTGESTQHIDWKLFARTEKLFVKRFEEETNLRCQIVIDRSSSMYFPLRPKPDPNVPDKFLFSVYSAASLMELMRRQRDAVGLSLFDDSLQLHTKARSNRAHHQYLLSELERLIGHQREHRGTGTATAHALHQVAELSHQRSLIIIFSDMFDNTDTMPELFAALQHLRYNKHEVVLFHVTDHQMELELMVDDRPTKFVDLENGEKLRLNPMQIREAYRDAMVRQKNELKLKCGQYSIDYVEANINKGYHQVLMEYMIKRSRLY
jgi:uncharacterized protein (DUF58 family)